jgi:beta-ureidopropionase
MRLALAQYALGESAAENLETALSLLQQAATAGAQIILYPELCLSRFFPQFAGGDASSHLVDVDDARLLAFQRASRGHGIWSVPNLYFAEKQAKFDASLLIANDGEIAGISKMVHIAQAPGFYEKDYYTPSDSGFRVFDTPLGRIGIVICFDRHFPESIRTCVLQGAHLILIPTANTMDEPREMFEWEIRVAARQNGVWIAMCNRVGEESSATFCGDSIVVDPEGNVAAKAGEDPQLLLGDLDLSLVSSAWQRSIYLDLLRPECYVGASVRQAS